MELLQRKEGQELSQKHLNRVLELIQEGIPGLTYGVHSLNLISSLAGLAGTKSVQGSDSVCVPLALDQTSHLALQLRYHVSTGLPLICSSLAPLHIVASDASATVILGWLPSQEDTASRFVSPLQVLWRVWDSWEKARPQG